MKGYVLTYLLTYGGSALALINPFVGVVVYWIFAIVRPQFLYGWSGLRGNFSEIIAIATLIGWAARGFGNWNLGRGKPAVYFLLAYYLWGSLSALFAPFPDVAWVFVREQLKIVLMFVVAVTLADTPARARALAWTLVGSIGYLCFEFNLEYLKGSNVLHEYGFGGMDNNSVGIQIVTVIAPAGFLGLYERRLWAKGLAWLSAAFAGHAVLLSFSRGAMLGLIVSGLVAFWILPKRPRYLVPVLIAALLGLRFAGPQVRDRFMTTFQEEQRDVSAQSRLDMWRSCVRLMAEHPLLGIGTDHFPKVAADLGYTAGKEAHTLWLQLGAEIGIPGLVFLLLFYATPVWRLRPYLRRGPPDDDLARWLHMTAGMVVAGLTGFAVSAQFVSLKGLETPFFLAAVGVVTLRLGEERAPQEASVPQRALPGQVVRPLPPMPHRPAVPPRPSGTSA